MSHIVVCHILTCLAIRNNGTRGKAHRNVPRAAVLIHAQIPVDPAIHAAVQIPDDVMCVVPCIIFLGMHGRFSLRKAHALPETSLSGGMQTAAFRHHEGLIRIELLRHLYRFKMIAGIPVEGNAAYHLTRLFIQHRLCPLEHSLLVVVPDKDSNLLIQPGLYEFRIEVFDQEGLLICSGPHTGIPVRCRDGLVLHGHHRDRNPLCQICLYILHQIFCPGCVILLFERSSVVTGRLRVIHCHLMAGAAVDAGVVFGLFRRCFPLIRRRPGGEQHRDLLAARLLADPNGLPDHRNDVFMIPLQREGYELRICNGILHGLILLQGKITAVHVRPDIAKPCALSAIVGFQDSPSFCILQCGEKVGAGLCHCTAKALDLLVRNLRIQIDDTGLQVRGLIGLPGYCQFLFLHHSLSVYAKGCNLSAGLHRLPRFLSIQSNGSGAKVLLPPRYPVQAFSNHPKAALRPRSQASHPFQSSPFTVSMSSFQLQ